MNLFILKGPFAKAAFALLNVCVLLVLSINIFHSMYDYGILQTNQKFKIIATQINFSKSINSYAEAIREEIQIMRNTNFQTYEARINSDFKNIEKKVSKYQQKEFIFELNKMFMINKNIINHLKAQEIDLAQKLYKTEFLYHKEKLINLIDSIKKQTIMTFQNEQSSLQDIIPQFHIKLLGIFISFFFALISIYYFYKKHAGAEQSISLVKNQLEVALARTDTLKNINEKLEVKNLYLHENLSDLKQSIKGFKADLNTLNEIPEKKVIYNELENCLDDLFKISGEKEINLKEVSTAFAEHKDKINSHNKKIEQLEKNMNKINHLIVNFEINNKPIDTVVLKRIISDFNNISQINYDINLNKVTFSELHDLYLNFKQYFEQIKIEFNNILIDNNDIIKSNNNKIKQLENKITDIEFELLSLGGKRSEKFI